MSYLFFDIDGTILNKKHYPEKTAVEAISQAMKNGHTCFFCTGRSYKMCDELKEFGIKNAVIANGAAVIIDHQIISAHFIDEKVVEETIHLAESLEGGLQLLDVNYGYQNNKTHQEFERQFKEREPENDVDDVFKRRCMKRITEWTHTPILKIDVVFDSSEKAEYFIKHMSDSLQYIPAGGYVKAYGSCGGELILKGISKGTGIQEVVDNYHIEMKDTYGFGDSDNDIGMLETVAHPVVMKPGTPELLKLAEYIAQPPEEGGIQQALSHYKII